MPRRRGGLPAFGAGVPGAAGSGGLTASAAHPAVSPNKRSKVQIFRLSFSLKSHHIVCQSATTYWQDVSS